MPDEFGAGGPPIGMPLPPPEKKKPAMPLADEGMREQVNSLAARVRMSEERASELRKKMLVVEQNMLSHNKKTITDTKSLSSDITEIRRQIAEIEDRIITIIKELRLTARKEDIDVLKKYTELWNPMRFASQDQVEKICREIIEEKVEELTKGLKTK